jgi:hypothetical protein
MQNLGLDQLIRRVGMVDKLSQLMDDRDKVMFRNLDDVGHLKLKMERLEKQVKKDKILCNILSLIMVIFIIFFIVYEAMVLFI